MKAGAVGARAGARLAKRDTGGPTMQSLHASTRRARWRCAILGLVVGAALAGGPVAAQPETARFRVTDRVVLGEMMPFTTTIGGIGNALVGSDFEPRAFRNKLIVTEAAANRVIASPDALTDFGTLREGALDGAEVEVFRIEDGGWHLLRSDRIAEGGHAASSWLPATGPRMVPAQDTRFLWRWRRVHRQNAETWFTVRAVDRDGGMSAPATPIMMRSPAEIGPSKRPNNRLVNAPSGMDATAPAGRGAGAPTGLSARLTPEGYAELTWTAPPGRVAGYVVYASEVPPDRHRGHFLELEGDGPPLEPGDRVFVRKMIVPGPDEPVVSDEVWNSFNGARLATLDLLNNHSGEREGGYWTLERHPPDTPVSDPGETFLRLSYSPADEASIGRYAFAGTDQSYYEVLHPGETYRAEVWLRGQADAPVEFRLTGPLDDLGPFRMPVTDTWQKHVVEFTVPRLLENRIAGRMELYFPGTGTVDVDNYRVYRAAAPWMGWQPEDLEAIRASGMSHLRTHTLIKTGTVTYDLAQLLDPERPITGRRPNSASLAQSLVLADEAQMDPWIQVEPHLSRAEWLGLAEYLAAPFDPAVDSATDKPWAALRAAQGRPDPWVDAFGTVFFEVGNETWNGLFAPWTFDGARDGRRGARLSSGTVYGLYQEYVLSVLRESPYWDALAPKLVPVLGGRSRSTYGADAALASPSSTVLTAAHYIGGWDEDEGPAAADAEGLFRVLTAIPQQIAVRGRALAEDQAAVNARRDRPIAIGTYEAGPGYALDGLNNRSVSREEVDEQERAMKSKAAGTATLDAFLTLAGSGYAVQNFFTFGRGGYWSSHAPWYKGGHAYPSWDLLALFNREGLGDMLAVETLDVPRADLPRVRRQRPALEDAPLVAVHATRSGDRMTVVVVSRRVPDYPVPGDPGRTRVEIDLPFRNADNTVVYSMTGAYNAHNVDGPEVRLETRDAGPLLEPGRLVVPELGPGETLVFVLDGVSG